MQSVLLITSVTFNINLRLASRSYTFWHSWCGSARSVVHVTLAKSRISIRGVTSIKSGEANQIHNQPATVGMENSSPSLSQYMCVDDDNKDKCTTSDRYLTAVIITRYLPLVMVPFISYLSIVYVYPVISFRLKRHLRNPENYFHTEQDHITHDSNGQEVNRVARKWKALHLQGLLATNCYIYCVLWLCFSPADLIHYNNSDKGFLASTDHYILYVHKAISVVVLIIMIGGVFLRWTSLISSISTSITLNIIYMVCYFLPNMLVGFIYDPLEAMQNCCMTIVVILSSYLLTWYCLALFMFSKLALKQAYLSLFSWKGLFHCLTFAIMVLSYCICFIIFGAVIEILRSDINYQQLKILCLLISSLVVCTCAFKPIHHCAYKYAIANAELMTLHVFNHDDSMEDDEEKNTTVSYPSAGQHFINRSTYDNDTKSEENCGYFQRNKSVIV